ncbi:MAG: outer-membrane lipoprotein carrier protein LolA, partial [Alphaproteobacteria bacterium]|nr:outer-membrane lipoprotein carrier protein LolA [Alphaproteobacteria bacterium]
DVYKRQVPVLKKKEAERFRVAPTDKITAYHFILTPKDKTRGVSHMELWVSKKGSIIRAKCYTMENKLIDFLFYNIKLNQSIADKEFQFVIPPSAQVLKNSFMQSP